VLTLGVPTAAAAFPHAILVLCSLANEITNLSDAATLYPLFGLGANLAQAIAGLVLKVNFTLHTFLSYCKLS
jgi:ATP/ADP translocase